MKIIDANIPFQTTNDKIAIQITDVPANLAYSVDNIVYTDWKDQITEINTVITNIPRGLYLKLDAQCIITD